MKDSSLAIMMTGVLGLFLVSRVQVKELRNPAHAFDTILGLIVRLAQHGLIHCDFNEFNLMVQSRVIHFERVIHFTS